MKRVFLFYSRINIVLALTVMVCFFNYINSARATTIYIPSVNYPNIPRSGESVSDFVPNGWEIEIQSTGDINNDNIEDIVMVLRKNNIIRDGKSNNISFNANPRVLIVLAGLIDKRYALLQYNKDLIPMRTDPNVEDYLDGVGVGGVEIQRGLIKVTMSLFYNMGSWEIKNYTFIFRCQNDRFELIGYESSSVNRSSGEMKDISINYTTRKVKITCGNNQSDGIGETIWRKLPLDRIWTIDSVGNGIEFDPDVRANCNDI